MWITRYFGGVSRILNHRATSESVGTPKRS